MKRGFIAALAALMVIGTPISAKADEGWQEIDGIWHYGNSAGGFAKDCWKKYGDSWYYLNSNGYMLTNSFIDDDDSLYYVGDGGEMISSQWRYLNRNGEDSWYYFGSDGKAYKNTSSKVKQRLINNANYIFDGNGRMLYGWIDEDGNSTESYEDGTYYCGNSDDGSVKNGWVLLDIDCDHDDCEGKHWFYFNNGKKVLNKSSYNVNGKRYGFDDDGVMLYGFNKVDTATSSNATYGYKYYGKNDDGANVRGNWFKTIPSDEIDVNGYNDEDLRWFYANSDGSLKASEIAKIKNKKYAFNEYGEMVYGLCGLKFTNDKITTCVENIDSLSQLDSAISDGCSIYYFNGEDDGHMETGSKQIVIDGEKYDFKFNSSGVALDGINNNSIYVNGRLICADDGDIYGMFEINGTKSYSIGTAYLVNESGKIQINKSNVKDDYGYYYCTNSDGIVTYRSTTKK